MIFQSSSFWVAVAFFIVLGAAFFYRKKLLVFLDSHIEKVRNAIDEASKFHQDQLSLYSDMEDQLKGVESTVNNMFATAREKLDHIDKQRQRDHETLCESQEKTLNYRLDLMDKESVARLNSKAIDEIVNALEDRFTKKPEPLIKCLEQCKGIKL